MTNKLPTKEDLENGIKELTGKYGEWTYDIPLPHDVWTRGNRNEPFMRLKRILQVAHDLADKPLSQCRVLDLACLDGQIAIEFALQGADTVGVEIREENIKKAEFCRTALGLDNLQFVQDDVRNISKALLGSFDIIVCSGILYHLEARDAAELIETMHEMCDRLLIIDTHTAYNAGRKFTHKGTDYFGSIYIEHGEKDTQAEKSKKLWASWGNDQSFWFTRPSLVNLISSSGFSSVYECFAPIFHDEKLFNRCTFVAIKDKNLGSITSRSSNNFSQKYREGVLYYSYRKLNIRDIIRWFINRLR